MNTLDQRLDSAAADLWMEVDRAHDTVGADQLSGSQLEPNLAPVVMIRRWDSPPRPHRARIVFAVAAAAAIVGVLVVAERPGKEPVGPVTPIVPSMSPTTTADVATDRDKALAALAAEKKLLEERAAQEAARSGSTDAGAEATTTATATPSHLCTGADLTAIADSNFDSAMSNTKLVVQVTNTGSAPCSLPDAPPTLIGVDDDGTEVPLVSRADQTYFGKPQPLKGPLPAGGTAVVWIGGGRPTVCDPIDSIQRWPSILLGLPDGTTVEFTTTFDTKCGVSISPFGAS